MPGGDRLRLLYDSPNVLCCTLVQCSLYPARIGDQLIKYLLLTQLYNPRAIQKRVMVQEAVVRVLQSHLAFIQIGPLRYERINQ